MRLRTLTAALAVAFLAALPLVAQEQRGSVEGVVKDAQGGAVVGATVTAKHLNGASQTAVTDATGTYRFVTLPPGHYEITAALSGFAPSKVSNIDLRLGQVLSVNMTLSPGGVTETVQVVGDSLVVRGEKRFERESGEGRWRVVQCAYGSFHRSVPLPAAVKADEARASYRNGVLRVELPKQQPAQPKTLQIRVD